MASYRGIDVVTLMSAGVMTGTSVISTTAMDVQHLDRAAFSAVWTGTPNGTFKVEGSLDGTNYADLSVTVAAATGAADFRVVSVSNLCVKWVRLTYTNTSSTGSLTVKGMAKGNG